MPEIVLFLSHVRDFIVGMISGSEPLGEGFITLVGYLLFGFVLAYRNKHVGSVDFLARYAIGLTLYRYVMSYWAFGVSLREGAWVLVWAISGIVGVWLGQVLTAQKARSK